MEGHAMRGTLVEQAALPMVMSTTASKTVTPPPNVSLARPAQRLFKELFYRKGFQYDNMFDWTVLNLQNERGRGGSSGGERPAAVTRLEGQRDSTGAAAAGTATPLVGRTGGDSGAAGAAIDGGGGERSARSGARSRGEAEARDDRKAGEPVDPQSCMRHSELAVACGMPSVNCDMGDGVRS